MTKGLRALSQRLREKWLTERTKLNAAAAQQSDVIVQAAWCGQAVGRQDCADDLMAEIARMEAEQPMLEPLQAAIASIVEGRAHDAKAGDGRDHGENPRFEAAEQALSRLQWQPIATYPGKKVYVPLLSPAHGQVFGAHVTGDVWHLVGVGCVTGESERPTHWFPLPDPLLTDEPPQEPHNHG